MRYKLICCEVFVRLACMAVAESPHIVDPEFTKLGAHESPDTLRKLLQEKIDIADEAADYDAVLLGYGLCGNSTAGLKARSVPLVIPRAHDCCTIFLGSREKFVECFKDNPSAEWSAVGYMERNRNYLRETDTGKLLGLDRDFDEYVEKYGEENAKYIWQMLHPENHNTEMTYIEVPETAELGYLERFKTFAAEKGGGIRVIDGDMRLVRGLVSGQWNEDEYLIVPPGRGIRAVYDHDRVICID